MSEVIRIPLRNGGEAVIDVDDWTAIAGKQWSRMSTKNGTPYACRRSGRRVELMHRLIMGDPIGLEVDHIDGDGLNNTRANLRAVSRSQNSKNRAHGHGKTGVLNVYFRNGRYEVVIPVDAKQRRFGRFSDLHEAAVVAYEARLRYYGPEAVARIPDPRLTTQEATR